MAVEAHHLLHTGTGGQKLTTHAGWASTAPATGRHACYGREIAVGVPSQQGYQHSCMGLVAPAPPPLMGQYGHLCAADAAESGVTFGGAQEVAPRKRRRAEHGGELPVLGLGSADVAAHFQQQLVDVDRLVLHHTAKMWAELTEQRRWQARQVVAAVEAAAAKLLRAKHEELERIGRLNWALEEQVKSLYVEAQVWRDLAQSNEAAANAVRCQLQQALDAQARRGVGAGADDAESCFCGDNDVAGGTGAGEEEAGGTTGRARCKVCGEGAAEVLLLPCRHLCACAPCAAAARACPACGCAKNGSVRVNLS
ncbi:probable BOI-related E3 ubiquitin-protein ligase 3 [Phragmites australis]|uniref:probable BOI-related E3 ubiquitin-protein ligase 3 n=1 Tax=Phragmites australis TaxID=29695 RepID=UPI002D76EBA7|nr:probable BOI-related E3 ubiquitin-protein ligase 3 [Phragmites australis]